MKTNEFELTLNQINLLEQLYLHKDSDVSIGDLMLINNTQDNSELKLLKTLEYTSIHNVKTCLNSYGGHDDVTDSYKITPKGIAFFEHYRYKIDYDKQTIDIANQSINKSGKANILSIIAITISGVSIAVQIILNIIF